MELVYDLLVVCHLLGMAAILGGVLADLRRGPEHAFPLVLVAASVQVCTGLALAGIASAGLVDIQANNAKLAAKLLIALVVLGIAFAGHRVGGHRARPFRICTGVFAIGAVMVAAVW